MIPSFPPKPINSDGKPRDGELDAGIGPLVNILRDNGIETYESCQGGEGHCFAEPTIRFGGMNGEGPLAVGVALRHGMPVCDLRHVWHIVEGVMEGPGWELVFIPSRMEAYLKSL